ncbi:hypothetical protein Asp14428_55490 [Actinoplanes sp. NBRC 14428]|uniref:Uncharacterized protein n=1 Tax=Pseudosporangium ferrugineum TaxID=439699 RepID=A0A2T0S4F1_9ACTN|nr:hypothetical protein [Pseudosporangium ferrugineum]PRY28298.1 hypothetical protein CLV70_10890 [Pseudosporangium ferrugineum]BCJ54074.1 hypothetical protein Asp14428_55490 [Actinoplanes sp. NBRC 14428]
MDDTLLTISAGADGPALASFCSWLQRTPEVARHGRIRAMPARDGVTMNAVATIGVVISSATGIANVLIAYGNWRRTRPKAPAVTVTLGSVTVTVEDPEALEKLTRALSGGHAA